MSAIPDAVDALVSAWQAANITLAIEGNAAPLAVVDGPVWDVGVDFLAVGWDRSDQPVIVGTGDTEDLFGAQESETFDVSCLLCVWYGRDRNVSAVRRAQFDAFKQLRAALDTLTSEAVVATAEMAGRELTIAEIDGGVAADLRFDVHITAYGA